MKKENSKPKHKFQNICIPLEIRGTLRACRESKHLKLTQELPRSTRRAEICRRGLGMGMIEGVNGKFGASRRGYGESKSGGIESQDRSKCKIVMPDN